VQKPFMLDYQPSKQAREAEASWESRSGMRHLVN